MVFAKQDSSGYPPSPWDRRNYTGLSHPLTDFASKSPVHQSLQPVFSLSIPVLSHYRPCHPSTSLILKPFSVHDNEPKSAQSQAFKPKVSTPPGPSFQTSLLIPGVLCSHILPSPHKCHCSLATSQTDSPGPCVKEDFLTCICVYCSMGDHTD